MISKILFEENNHKWVVLGRDKEKKKEVIDTNEYIIISNGQAMLLDPGGIEIFPQVLTEMTKYISPENIKVIFASHQDPDIASSISMWVDLCNDLKVFCPWLWTGFISHFGMGTDLSLETIPDEGLEINIGTSTSSVFCVPAHNCHSPGNYSVYDPISDILFSGDIGAALLPEDYESLFVEDFSKHIKYMEGFHRRWMPSKTSLNAWVERVRKINPKMIAPQHGAIFKEKDIPDFLNWLQSLEVGEIDSTIDSVPDKDKIWLKWKK